MIIYFRHQLMPAAWQVSALLVYFVDQMRVGHLRLGDDKRFADATAHADAADNQSAPMIFMGRCDRREVEILMAVCFAISASSRAIYIAMPANRKSS